jgi:CRP-like cAMP-binding protein
MRFDAATLSGSSDFESSSLLRSIGSDEQERLGSFLERVTLNAGVTLATVGDLSEYVWFPAGAIISAVVRMDDGVSVEAALIGSEGVVGLDVFWGGRTALISAVVQIAGVAFRCRTETLRERLNEFPMLRRAVFGFASTLLATIAQTAACNATHNLRQRMSRWLLIAHDRAGRDRFRITHEFVAAIINVRRAGVSQFASELRGAGAIGYTRGEVRIIDRRVLEHEACECYQAIRKLTVTRAR